MPKSLTDLKAKHSDLTRRLETDAAEEQRIRAELQEKQAKLQQQANSDSQMAEALLRPILQRRERDSRERTKLEGMIEMLEQVESEKAALERAQVAEKEAGT
jgi:hypothetical protein